MTSNVRTCRLSDTLQDAAQMMREHRCGAIPIVDDASKIAGIVTDRDLLMAALVQGRALHETSIESAGTRAVVCCQPTDALEWAEELMRANRVRRLPVVDAARRVVGVLSLTDLARHVEVAAARPGSSLSPRQIALVLLATSGERGPDQTFPAFLPPDGDVFSSARTELDELTKR
jgi:CBS-domain-containing membrane protein